MKERTISSGGAPGTGGSGSMPTTSAAREGACVICTVGELVGTVEQAETASSRAVRATQRGPARRLMPTSRDGASRPGATAAASW